MNGAFSRTLGSFRTAFTAAVQHARVQRGARVSPFCPSGGQLPAKFNPSKLDFSPRIQFKNGKVTRYLGDEAGFEAAKPKCMPSRMEPCPVGFRAQTKATLLKLWAMKRLQHNPKACHFHGVTATMPHVGGNGGGKFRFELDHARIRASQHRQQLHSYHRCARPFSLRRHWASSAYSALNAHKRSMKGKSYRTSKKQKRSQALNRVIRGLTEHVRHERLAYLGRTSCRGPALTCDSLDATRQHDQSGHHHHHHQSPSLLRPPLPYKPPLARLVPPPPLLGRSSGLRYCCPPRPVPLVSARCFSSSPASRGAAHLAVHAVKLAQFMKSAEALSYINILFRISVSFIPLAWKRAIHMRRARLAAIAAGADAVIPSGLRHTIINIVCKGALALPFVLLAAVLLAALEKTPITGRWRLLLLNDKEERDVISKVLEVGGPTVPAVSARRGATANAAESRDWLTIMRAVLGEQNAPEGTLLGGKVLDRQVDWRVSFVEDVLSKLEVNLPHLTVAAGSESHSIPNVPSEVQELVPPALAYPLAKHARSTHLKQKNAVLVIDRPESNAFSFGFFGSTEASQPGVIIVFTGAIDEIMRSASSGSNGGSPPALSMNAKDAVKDLEEQAMLYYQRELKQEPSWLRAFMESLIPATSPSHGMGRNAAAARRNGPIRPNVTKEQEEALAVLLAHELAHLVLSHTIESYASTNLLWPQLEKLGWDMVRVLLYPVTALLGPFVQDAIAATVKVGLEESGGLLPALTSSCESRVLESEADIVALRLLSNAGIDPRASLSFWEDRLNGASSQRGGSEGGASRTRGSHAHAHTKEADSFMKTHPPDRERVSAIRKELARWTTTSAARN